MILVMVFNTVKIPYQNFWMLIMTRSGLIHFACIGVAPPRLFTHLCVMLTGRVASKPVQSSSMHSNKSSVSASSSVNDGRLAELDAALAERDAQVAL